MKHVLRPFGLVLVCATTAGALKMALPHASPLGTWPLWAHLSLRNKLGFLVGVPLYELWGAGWGYLLALGTLAATRPWWLRARHGNARALGLGALLGAGQYAAGHLAWCLRAAGLYAIHAQGKGAKPWYVWMEWPQDVALLGIYALIGVVGAGLYYRQQRHVQAPGRGQTLG